MDIANLRRGHEKSKITRIRSYLDKHPIGTVNVTVEDYKSRVETLELAFTSFSTIHSDISSYIQPEDPQAVTQHEEYFIPVEELYHDLKSKLNRYISSMNASVSVNETNPDVSLNSTVRSTIRTQSVEVRLPPLTLPSFSGDYADWTSFLDIFSSSVNGNTNLSDAHKLQYLKSSLKGEALSLIQHFSITNANYAEAWSKLKSRYGKQKQIIQSHIQKFLDQPTISNVSSSNLRQLTNTSDEVVRALKAINCESRDPWLIHIMLSKIDVETKQLWYQSSVKAESPTLVEFFTFLEERCDALESFHPILLSNKRNATSIKSHHVSTSSTNFNPTSYHKNSSSNKNTVHNNQSSASIKCIVCSNSHPLYQCSSFKGWHLNSRREFVRDNNLCFNCMFKSHSVKECKARSSCQQCNKRHHTLLHPVDGEATVDLISTPHSSNTPSTSTSSNTITTLSSVCNSPNHIGILPTAIVYAKDIFDQKHLVRLLFDTGSESSLMSESCCQLLGLKRENATLPVKGVKGVEVGYTRGKSSVQISSRFNENDSLTMNVYILNRLSDSIPSQKRIFHDYNSIKSENLADPDFDKPNKIDIILGTDYFLNALGGDKLFDKNGVPIAFSSLFGWVIGGQLNPNPLSINCNHLSLETDFQKFWELEEVDMPKFTKEEELCEKHFMSTHSQNESGRFIVRLPFKNDDLSLGESCTAAISRLYSVERKFKKDLLFKEQYTSFMEEYFNLNHMIEVPFNEVSKPGAYYIPHHAVVKESSTTTKLRVVFDASVKSSTGVSLNDNLLVGPTVQPELFTTILKFRIYLFAFTADIEKMYRQINIHPDDMDSQRIVWRSSPDQPIQHFKLSTVTYGTSAAPYLATRTLNQVGINSQERFPDSAKIIQQNFYVDDLLSGSDDLNSAIQRQQELISILSESGLNLRKWAANHPKLLEQIPISDRALDSIKMTEIENDKIKTLGVIWKPSSDTLMFQVKLPEISSLTKRNFLSEMAKLFDPLGWLAPAVITYKILFQRLWLYNLNWDDTLPDEICKEWIQHRSKMKSLEHIQIQRWIPIFNKSLQIHGFCDASKDAYSAVVYSRTIDNKGDIQTNIVTSKTRLSPLNQVSIPRLELCGAVLLVRLLNKIKNIFTEVNVEYYCWTDSMIFLHWISSPPRRWNTFVANRTSEVITSYPPSHWRHIGTKENPADVASRGISPQELVNHQLWFKGPSFLMNSEDSWSTNNFQISTDEHVPDEVKPKIQVLITVTKDPPYLLTKFSSLEKLKRITAWCLRFVKGCKKQRNPSKILTSSELQEALNVYIKWTQEETYSTEFQACRQSTPLSTKSSLLKLNPRLDTNGIIRVGGRLENSNLSFNSKHPIILPANSILSKLIISELHIKIFHAGVNLLITQINKDYWMTGLRAMVKQIVHKCMTCARQKAQTKSQIMGNLPSVRVTPARPFLNSGCDYAGPFNLKRHSGRNSPIDKAYIALFVCLATKALHLELVSDLSTDAFLASYKRFTARRGHCMNLYCDNGTNFIGANSELQRIKTLVNNQKHQDIISKFGSFYGTTFHFIPPGAPHFGGIWEAGVKSVKFHLRRMLDEHKLNFEEMSTLITQIEAILNSRPLCAISTDPDVYDALTPAHFLIGEPTLLIQEPNIEHLKVNRLNRWQFLQRLHSSFWKRWQTEYISTLQQRNKWQQEEDNLKINDLVLVKDNNLPPSQWLLGRVTVVHPGLDGKVRAVTIRHKNGEFQRPIHKLCKMPVE